MLNTASKILLIIIATILRKINPMPSHPTKIETDKRIEPKSF